MKTLYTRAKPTATCPIQHSTNESLQISISHPIQHSVRGIILVRNAGKGRAGWNLRKKEVGKGLRYQLHKSLLMLVAMYTGCTEISYNNFDAYPVAEICFCHLYFYYHFDATVSLLSFVRRSRSFLLSFSFFVALLRASVFVHKKLKELFNEMFYVHLFLNEELSYRFDKEIGRKESSGWGKMLRCSMINCKLIKQLAFR